MGRARFLPRRLATAETTPFDNAEEAWLWYAHCQLARMAGCRPRADLAATARPCDPDDIHRAAMGLYRQGRMDDAQLRVLAELGMLVAGSAATVSWTASQDRLWRQALDLLDPILRAKGIVA